MVDVARHSGLPKAEATKAIESMRNALAAWQQERRRAGLARSTRPRGVRAANGALPCEPWPRREPRRPLACFLS
jgi:hypothetical protein